jgi:Tfp pilus assembly protein PilF
MEYLISTPRWLDADLKEPEKSVARLVPAVQKLLSSPITAADRVVVPKLPRLVHAQRKLRRLQIAVVAMLLLALAGAGMYRYLTQTDSVVVMPFRNETGQEDLDEYLIAFPWDIITALRKLPPSRFSPKPRLDVLREWAASGMDPVEAGASLDADKVLTGTFHRAGGALSFRAELFVPSEGAAQWVYPRDPTAQAQAAPQLCLKDPANRNRLLPLRRVVLEGILDNISPRPSAEDRAKVLDPPTNSCEAYDLYIQARAEWNRRNAQGFRQAIALYKQAILLDSKFALAYSGLADSYSLLADYSVVKPTDEAQGFPAASREADRAIQLRSDLAEPHVSKAFYLFQHEWKWKEAEAEFDLAYRYDRNYATGLQWKAVYLSAMGRHDESLSLITQAMKVDADSPILATNRGWLLHLARRSEEAEKQLKDVIRKTPHFEEAHRQLGDVYLARKDYRAALAEYSEAQRLFTRHTPAGSVEYEALVARAKAFLGEKNEALKTAELSKAAYAREYFPASYIALLYIALDDKASAFAWLNQSLRDRSAEMILLNVDPSYDSLRQDPRFEALVRTIGLPKG